MTDFEAGVRRVVGQLASSLAAAARPGDRTVTVQVVVGDPVSGRWCNRCLLPSAVEFPIDGLHEGGVVPLGRVRACSGCGQLEQV